MKLYSMTCPNCAAPLNYEDGITSFYCKHCGYKIILSGQTAEELNAKLELERIRSEEKIKKLELENKKLLDERRQAQEEKENRTSNLVGIMAFCSLIFLLLMTFINDWFF